MEDCIFLDRGTGKCTLALNKNNICYNQALKDRCKYKMIRFNAFKDESR